LLGLTSRLRKFFLQLLMPAARIIANIEIYFFIFFFIKN